MRSLTIWLLLLSTLCSASASGSQQVSLESHGATILISVSGQGRFSQQQLQSWIGENADGVSEYFGRFPVEQLQIDVRFVPGDGLYGRTYGYPRPRISLQLGDQVSLEALRDHWILTHEMTHLGFPNAENQRWMEEGMATYLEPIVRSRAGQLEREQFWRDMLWGIPQGTAKPGHRGLVYDKTWGRTYWGGALFWFLIDLDIRQRTGGQKSVDDVFRAILQAGGNIESVWSMEQIAETGDRATGTDSLSRHLGEYGYRPGRVELGLIWRKLGVVEKGGQLFLKLAPWSNLRDAITDG